MNNPVLETRPPSKTRTLRLVSTLAALLSMVGIGLIVPSTVLAATKVATVPFKLTAAPSSVQVAPGGSVVVTVSSTRTKGFTSSIYLGVTGVAKGVKVKLSRNPLTTGATKTNITISPSSTFVPKTFSLTVSGSSKGKTSRVVVKVIVKKATASSSSSSADSTQEIAVDDTPATPSATTTTLPTATTSTTSTTRPVSATTTTAPFSDYDLKVAPSSLPIAAGGTATATLQIIRSGGFNQALDATVEGLPTGMTGSVDPIGPGDNTSTIRLSTSSTIVTGTYDLTIRARGRSAILKVSVSGSALGISPSSLTVGQGASATATVTLGRAVSASTVTWSVDVLPVGVTAAFNPNATTATSSTMTVSATTAAGPGTYIVTLRSTSDGGSVTSPFTVIVTAGTAGAAGTATVSPSVVNIVPGGNASITVTPGSLPAGTPSLAATGLPTGTAAAVSLTGSTFTYNFTVPLTTAVGTYPVTFQITQGGATSSGTFSLVVSTTVAPTVPTTPATNTTAFTIQAQPAAASIARGAIGVVTIPVVWAGGVLQQPITFSSSGGPAGTGFAYTANPSAIGTTLNVAIPVGATPGAYTVTVSGNVASLGTSSVTIALTVT